MRDVAILVQEAVGFRLVTAKMQGSNESDGHDLGIANPALRILVMMQFFQKIVKQAENCYNLAVNVASRFSCGLGTFNFIRSCMDFSFNLLR
jgi:hypothetical protein